MPHLASRTLPIDFQSASLTFQFILADLFRVYVHVNKLGKKKPDDHNFLDHVYTHLKSLGNIPSDFTVQFIPWHQEKGLLVKLVEFSKVLVEIDGKFKKLNQSLTKCQLLCTEALEFYHKKQESFLHKKIESLIKALLLVFNGIPLLIKNFKQDENVLLFLFTHYEKFENIYTSAILNSMIEKLDSKGVENLKSYILKCYAKRGFTNQTSLILEKINRVINT